MKRIFPILLILIGACTLFDDGREAGMELMPMSGTKWVYTVISNGTTTYANIDSVVYQMTADTVFDSDSNIVNVVRRIKYNNEGKIESDEPMYWRNDSIGFYNYILGTTLPSVEYLLYPIKKGKTWAKDYDYYLMNSLYDSVFVQVKGVETLENFGDCWVVEKHFASTYYDTYPIQILKSWYAPDVGLVKELVEFDGKGWTYNLERYE